MAKIKETEIAKPIISYLEELGWDVYQEVLIHGSIADIVATFNKLTWIIECKTSLSLKVLEQAYNWRGKANLISIGIPSRKFNIKNGFVESILIKEGIGQLTVPSFSEVREDIKPRLNRKTIDIFKFLKQEQKTFSEAGNKGKYFTPFKNTVLEIQRVVVNNQGILFSDLIKEIDHHYRTSSTAKSCLKKYIESGIIKNISIRKENNLLKVYYK